VPRSALTAPFSFVISCEEKAGAVREGRLRKRLLIRGQPHDAVLFSLVAEDLN